MVSVLLFGRPEDVISKRAADVRAKLIAFGHYGSSSSKAQRGLIRHIVRRVACPVMVLHRVLASEER